MAEAVFHSLTASNPRIAYVDSAGTGAYHAGQGPDRRTRTTLEDNGILNYQHAARLIETSDFTRFDYVLAMDSENLLNLQRLKEWWLKNGGDGKKKKCNVMLFGDFGGRKCEEVIDPYYGARHGFDVAYEQMMRFSKGFIRQVLGEEPTPNS